MVDTRAVLCIVGAILINLTLGTFYSIGNLIPYIASYMRNNGNPDVTSEYGTWITASFLLGQGAFIIVGSYIEHHYDSRFACIFGCIIHCLSTYLTIWAIKVSFLAVIVIYGFGSGLGCGSAYVASIIAAQKWFPQKKGVFTGIIVAGFGFGGLIFTSLQTIYLNPDNESADSSGYFNSVVYEKVPNLFLYMAITFTIVQAIGCSLAFPAPEASTSVTSRLDGSTAAKEERQDVLPDMTSIYSTFKHTIFYIIGAMMMMVAPGVTFVNSLGKRYGQSYIDDDRFLATVVSVAAISNALGRLTWGYLIDKFSFGTCFMGKVILFATLITLFPFAFVLSSKTLYLMWMLGLFFGFSGTFVLFPVLIEQVFGAKYHGIIYGILYIFLALSSITTSLIIQLAVSPALAKDQSPDEKLIARLSPCLLIALLYLISLVLYYCAVPVSTLEGAINRRKNVQIN